MSTPQVVERASLKRARNRLRVDVPLASLFDRQPVGRAPTLGGLIVDGREFTMRGEAAEIAQGVARPRLGAKQWREALVRDGEVTQESN